MGGKENSTGAWCVYFQYRKGTDEIPQIILRGTKDQCLKHIEEYNRISPEKYRCKLIAGPSKEILDRIASLKKMYGTVDQDS